MVDVSLAFDVCIDVIFVGSVCGASIADYIPGLGGDLPLVMFNETLTLTSVCSGGGSGSGSGSGSAAALPAVEDVAENALIASPNTMDGLADTPDAPVQQIVPQKIKVTKNFKLRRV